MEDSSTSLPKALLSAAAKNPESVVGIFDRRGRKADTRTHAEILRSAGSIAARLEGWGLRAGDRVVVALPTSWAWFDAWLGTLLLGGIPVAVPPTLAAGGAAAARRVAEAADTVRARLIVGGKEISSLSPDQRRELYGTEALTPEELATAPSRRLSVEPGSPEDELAFLQFTSGSTGRARAVMISHRGAIHQAYSLDVGVGAPWDGPSTDLFDAAVSWLPLYHDMGLLSVFYSMLNGRDHWQLSPQAFLARPRAWLELAGTRGTTVAPAPNFGYQLCAERLGSEEAADLDLSSFRAALTGAEMVRGETVEAFCERFGPLGFDRASFRPCYGLAEGTLCVTLDREGRGPRSLPAPGGADAGLGLDELIGTGVPVPETEVRIVAPDGSTLPPGELGEVQIQGPSVFLGYYNDPAATAETLVDGWLRTGDLGFLDDGELFIAGRLKEILIIRGQNLMPHEFERLAESATAGGGSTRAAAFSISRGNSGEELVVVAETAERDEAALAVMVAEVRSRIGLETGIPVSDIALVRRGRIPKTTSGKVQRSEVRRIYLEGDLQRLL